MAHGHHDPGLSWDWDSVLLLSNSILQEPGANSSNSHKEPPSTTRASSVHVLHEGHEQWHTNDTSTSRTQANSVSSETLDKGVNGDKRRDPRLDCPNFLAGRVPCACTDNDDDDESGVSRKRPKPVPRCQVASCSADLTDLKGYHQRHRVCLRCAHATRVILRDQPHRYCQQCGKFHPICDFDEGKRSCRRKLERHNNRRRRKTNEEDSPAFDGGDIDPHNESSQIDGTSNSTKYEASDAEPKVPSIEQQAPTAEQTCQDHGNRLNIADDVPNSELSLSCIKVSQQLELHCSKEQSCSPEEHTHFNVKPHHSRVHAMCADDFSLHSTAPAEPEEVSPSQRGNDEESLMALLLGENMPSKESRMSENFAEQPIIREAIQPWESSNSPESLNKEVSYCSPLPTGRISFKLYNWNPGDFPRQLRQQIMEWLSNMPVDLEGYIRSGCTILTIFIAMPQFKWDELNADWAGSVLKLVKADQTQSRFWTSGYLIARMGSCVVHINNGELVWPLSERLGTWDPPVLHGMHPMCLEAGCEEEVVVFGHNIDQEDLRLLVSFGGKYFVSNAHRSHAETAKRIPNSADKEICRNKEKLSISMPSLRSNSCGTAYVEVEHVGGTSNYIPLLVAEKKIVDEVRTLEEELNWSTSSCCVQNSDGSPDFPYFSQCTACNLILDLGWVLQNLSQKAFTLNRSLEILELHTERLRRLLFFGVKKSWRNVVERVLCLAEMAGLLDKIGILENGVTALQVAILHCNLPMVEHLIGCAASLSSNSKSMYWWSLVFPGPQGLTALHIVALLPDALGFYDRLVETEDIECLWNSTLDHQTRTPRNYDTLEGKLLCRIELNELLSHDERKLTTDNLSIVFSDKEVVEDELIGSSRLEGKNGSLIQCTGGLWNFAPRKVFARWLAVSSGNFVHRGWNMYISRSRIRRVLSSVCVLLVFAGLCFMIRHPNQVILLLSTIRQCLVSLEPKSL